MKKAFAKAFPVTIPVMLGYIPLGIAFGLMLQHAGYNLIWAIVSSITILSGTGQFIEVSFLESATPLLEVAVLIVILNSRMMFYGLSFIDKFREMGWKKWYMIHTLTDETYALLCAVKAPDDVDEHEFMFAIALLDHVYWIVGGIIGMVAGTLIAVDTTGIDFIMTALFVVIAMDQWKSYGSHAPAIIGLACSVLFLVIIGPENFMIPSLIGILVLLILRRKNIETSMGEELADMEEKMEGKADGDTEGGDQE